MRQLRILVADDEPEMRKFVKTNLVARGFEVLLASDGIETLRVIEKELPDMLILDIMMPNLDGFEVCRKVREWSQMPIIVLSARGDERDKVKCLEMGADDYVTKPFSIQELIARINAVQRRAESTGETVQSVFNCHELAIDFALHWVTFKGELADLTVTEYKILAFMAHNAGKMVTSNQILENVWGEPYIGEAHLLHVNISRLREKLQDNPRNPRYIITRPGVGYMLAKKTEKTKVEALV